MTGSLQRYISDNSYHFRVYDIPRGKKNHDLSVPRKPGRHQTVGHIDIFCCPGVSYIYAIYSYIPIHNTAESKIDSPSNNSINT